MKNISWAWSLAICFASFGALPRIAADEVVWQNSTGGNWSNPTNWSGGAVPRETDTVSITPDGVYTVTLDMDAVIAGLTLGGTNGTQTLANANRRLTLKGRATVNLSGVLRHSGELTLGDTLDASGVINWTGGTLRGAGALKIAPAGALEISGSATKTLESATIENSGTITWAGGDFFAGVFATINNLATGIFEIRSSATLGITPGVTAATLNNSGVIRKLVDGQTTLGTRDVLPPLEFYNGGQIDIQRGTLEILGNGSASGSFTVANGAAFYIDAIQGFTLDSQSSVSGEGNITLNNAVDVNGHLSVSGRVACTGPVSVNVIPRFYGQFTLPFIAAGSMGGDGHITLTQQLNGIGTITANLTLSDSLSLTVASNAAASMGVLTLTGANTIENLGIAEITGISERDLSSNAKIINQEGALLTLTNKNSYTRFNPDLFTLTNAGTVRKSGEAGRFALQASFQNAGTVEVDQGEMWVIGDYVQASAGLLNITLRQAGEERFTCDGNATLAGNFKLLLADSLIPNLGDRYELCAFGSRTGEFAAVEAWKGGRQFEVEPRYEDNKFVLVVKTLPDLEAPRLSIARIGDQVELVWPEGIAAKLQATASLLPALWMDVDAATETNRVVLPADQTTQFFRLFGVAP